MTVKIAEAEISTLDALLDQGRTLEGAIRPVQRRLVLSNDASLQEFVSRSQSWIARVFGGKHRYAMAIGDVATEARMGAGVQRALAVRTIYGTLGAAKADIQSGVLTTQAEQITADLFADELEIAQFILGESHGAATVLAGAVLELALLRMCESRDLAVPERSSIGKLNDLLYRADPPAYELSVQKQIIAWADLRNDAAHGRWENIEPGQARLMIDGVRAFVG